MPSGSCSGIFVGEKKGPDQPSTCIYLKNIMHIRFLHVCGTSDHHIYNNKDTDAVSVLLYHVMMMMVVCMYSHNFFAIIIANPKKK